MRLIVISGPFTSFMMHTNLRRPGLMEKNALDFPWVFKEVLDFLWNTNFTQKREVV